MEKYNVVFKKKFGQNFLNNINVVKRIVKTSELDNNSLVIEVGPGGALMTRELSKYAKQVIGYEIDEDLKIELFKRLDGIENVDILFQDFLKSDIAGDIKKYKYKSLYFVSNVPYYITTPILLKLINSGLKFKKIVMMVQKEVGDRFSSLPGCKDYGSITVLLNYFFNVKCEFYVSRENFTPVPNVDSVIISMTEKDNKLKVRDFNFFEQLLRDSFQFKRKNIKNNLKKYDIKILEDVLKSYGYDLNIRAECLNLEVFVDLSNKLMK